MTQQPKPSDNNQSNLVEKISKSIKIDSLQKLATLVTALLTIWITYQAHVIQTQISQVQNNINKATFVNGLLENLITKDQKIKSDISLIIANRMIAKTPQDKIMIAEIAEQIYRDNLRQAEKYASEFDNNPENKGKQCPLNENTSFTTTAIAFKVLEGN